MSIICVVCGTVFSSTIEGRAHRPPMYCSKKCNTISWKRRNPEKHREYNKNWKRINAEKVRKTITDWKRRNPEKLKEYNRTANSRRRDKYREREYKYINRQREYKREWEEKNKERVKETKARDYYLGPREPHGENGWLRKARTQLRNARRLMRTGKTPEHCISQRLQSEQDSNSPT